MKAEKILRSIRILAALVVMPLAVWQSDARRQEQSGKMPAGNAQKGKQIFETLGCNKCHGSEGEGVSGRGQSGGGPRIASTSLALPAFIQRVQKPKGVMPPFGSDRATESDLADVYAFLETLKPAAKQETTAA